PSPTRRTGGSARIAGAFRAELPVRRWHPGRTPCSAPAWGARSVAVAHGGVTGADVDLERVRGGGVGADLDRAVARGHLAALGVGAVGKVEDRVAGADVHDGALGLRTREGAC